MTHVCTDTTLAPTSRLSLYVCTVCQKEHKSGSDVRRCHQCCKLCPVDALQPATLATRGEFCSPECERAFAKKNGRRRPGKLRPVRTFLCEGCNTEHTTTDPRKIRCSNRCTKRVSTRRWLKNKQAKEQQAS